LPISIVAVNIYNQEFFFLIFCQSTRLEAVIKQLRLENIFTLSVHESEFVSFPYDKIFGAGFKVEMKKRNQTGSIVTLLCYSGNDTYLSQYLYVESSY